MASGFDGLRAELQQRVRIAARRTATEWQRELQRTSPVDTGYMRDQTSARDQPTSTGAKVTARVDTDYAEMVSSGTRPHLILPVRAKALRFTIGSQVVFAARVNHPGTQPNDWWDEALRRLPAMVQRAWDSVR
jgi:hypothetical protein